MYVVLLAMVKTPPSKAAQRLNRQKNRMMKMYGDRPCG